MRLKYTPFQFQPDTNSLNKEEFDKMMDDLRDRPIDFVDYLVFLKSIKDDDPIYNNIFHKLGRANLENLKFVSREKKLIKMLTYPKFSNTLKYKRAMELYNDYKDKFPNWAKQNQEFFNSLSTGMGFSPNQ